MNDYLIASLERQWEEDPNSRVFLRLAEELRKAERFRDALGVCEQGLEKHPNYLPAQICHGRILHALGDLEAAETRFERVLERNPDNVHAFRGLGEIALDRGDQARAQVHFERLAMFDQSDEVLQLLERAKTAGGGQDAAASVDDGVEPEPDELPIEIASRDDGETLPGALEERSSGLYGGDDDELVVGGAHAEDKVDAPADFVVEGDTIEVTTEAELPWGQEEEAPELNPDGELGALYERYQSEADSEAPVEFQDTDDVWEIDGDALTGDDQGELLHQALESAEPGGFEGDDGAASQWHEDDDEIASSLTLATVYERQGHLEEARDMALSLKASRSDSEAVRSFLRRVENALSVESPSERKIRYLRNWLGALKEQHHVS